MMAQVVAVGAGLALAFPQGIDLAHSLRYLQVQAVLGLLQLAAQLLLLRGLQHKDQQCGPAPQLAAQGMNSTAA